MQNVPSNFPPEALDARARKALKARGHKLKPALTIGKAGLSAASVDRLAGLFDPTDLIKIRVLADTGSEAEMIGRQLADASDCHFVARIGKTVLLYKPAPPQDAH